MTTSIGAYEAKTHLPRLLDQVERGDSVTITKHGRAVARLVPVGARTSSPDAVIAALRAARTGVRRGRSSVRSMIDEGRR
jgi:prevent-host-death family protein